jgi:hypothetical protein
VPPSPPLPHHTGHCDDIPTLLGRVGTRRRHNSHCATYGSPVNDTLGSAHYGGHSTNRYTTTLEATPVRAHDAPCHLNRSRIRQDFHQLRGTARHTSTRREIVRHACKLLPPWPIKGGAVPQLRTRDDGQQSLTRSPPSPRYWHLPQSIPLGLGGQASSPTSLVATPLRAPRCKAIKCPEHTTAGCTAPAGTRINPVSLVASTEPSRGRSQRSLLVSVGTTFRTNNKDDDGAGGGSRTLKRAMMELQRGLAT